MGLRSMMRGVRPQLFYREVSINRVTPVTVGGRPTNVAAAPIPVMAYVVPAGDNSSRITPQGEDEEQEYLMVSAAAQPVLNSDRITDALGVRYTVIDSKNMVAHYQTRLSKLGETL
jgi:hypothetical protein